MRQVAGEFGDLLLDSVVLASWCGKVDGGLSFPRRFLGRSDRARDLVLELGFDAGVGVTSGDAGLQRQCEALRNAKRLRVGPR